MSGFGIAWPSLVAADSSFPDEHVAVGASGHRIEYADGSTRLCVTSGLWNVPLGYGNPTVMEAVTRAMHDASYLSLFRVTHRYAEQAASALVELAGRDRYRRVIYSTSGGAANDIAMKLARQYWLQRDSSSSRSIIVGLRGSYHGTMYGSHALSGDDLLQSVYSVDRRHVRHVSHDDEAEQLNTLLKREGSRVAAVVVEPVLGSGALPLSRDFVARLLDLREKYGFLIVADEVATGFHRTGPLFATDEWPVAPDLLLLSKALTNGAMGAAVVLVGPRVSDEFARGGWTFIHGETQAGSPACAAAILAVIDELRATDVEFKARALGLRLLHIAEGLRTSGKITAVTGRGCFLGLSLRHEDGTEYTGAQILRVISHLADEGVVVQPGPSSVELIPAFGFSEAELFELETALHSTLTALQEVRL